MFKKKTLEHYEDALVKGQLRLVRNRLIGKYKEYRDIGTSGSSDDMVMAHIMAFHTTKQHLTDETAAIYQRYEYDNRFAYKKAVEGEEYYLVLKPCKKNPQEIVVKACFPCETTTLSPVLAQILERDSDCTGFPVSLAQEQAERRARLKALGERMQAMQHKNQPSEDNDQQIFSEIANHVLKKVGLFFLMPLIILGSILLFAGQPAWGMGCLFGSCLLFVGMALLLIAFKKPLVARRKRRMGIDVNSEDL